MKPEATTHAVKQFIDAVIIPALLERLRREQAPTTPKAT